MVNLIAEWTLLDNALHVNYKISSTPDAPRILVFHVLCDRLPSGKKLSNPELIYVRADFEILFLEKIVPEIPSNMAVEEGEMPFVQLLQSGGSMAGFAVISLPVRSYIPYFGKSEVALDSSLKEAILRIGYVEISDDLTFWRQAKNQADGVYIVDFEIAYEFQKFLTSPSYKLPTGFS